MLYKAKFLWYDNVVKCGNTLGFVVIRELFPVFRPCRYDGQARFIEWAFARYIEQFHLPFIGRNRLFSAANGAARGKGRLSLRCRFRAKRGDGVCSAT